MRVKFKLRLEMHEADFDCNQDTSELYKYIANKLPAETEFQLLCRYPKILITNGGKTLSDLGIVGNVIIIVDVTNSDVNSFVKIDSDISLSFIDAMDVPTFYKLDGNYDDEKHLTEVDQGS